jgi:hypothetical protein
MNPMFLYLGSLIASIGLSVYVYLRHIKKVDPRRKEMRLGFVVVFLSTCFVLATTNPSNFFNWAVGLNMMIYGFLVPRTYAPCPNCSEELRHRGSFPFSKLTACPKCGAAISESNLQS